MQNGNLDISILRQFARDQLVMHLETVAGKKDLVLEKELMKPLDRIAGASLFKQHGVDKIYRLEPVLASHGEQRVYVLRPSIQTAKIVADHINSDLTKGIKRTYHLLYLPRKLHICDLILEQEGVCGYITTSECAFDLIPLDSDLLSLEMPNFIRSFFLDGDQTMCHTIAQSLLSLQQLFGLIPNVYGQGNCAKMVHDLTETMFAIHGEPKQLNNEIGHLFLFDRDADYVTPLCSQATYEGVIDEHYGINSGYVDFGPEVTGQQKGMTMLLCSQDPAFAEIRDHHVMAVSRIISAKAKQLQSGYDKRHTMTSVREMKEFVSNDLKDLKQQHMSITVHLGACENIVAQKKKEDFEEFLRTEHGLLEGSEFRENVNFIEEVINRQLPPISALRLLCLLSLTQDGLASSQYRSLKTQYIQSHGLEELSTLHNLKNLGLFTEQELTATKPSKLAARSSSNFRARARKLQLIPKDSSEVDLRNPNDMSYVFSGAYTPLLPRLVELVLAREGFTGLEETMKLFNGPNFAKVKAKSAKGAAPASARVVLVYFLGGCSFAEIAALRLLSRQKGYKIIVATTSIINGSSFIKLLRDKVR